MKFKKYIIVEDDGSHDFRFGFVEYHSHLASDYEIKLGKVEGGGFFLIDEKDKLVRLWGDSDDFGYPKDLEKKIKQSFNQIMTAISEFYYFQGNGEGKWEELEDIDKYKVLYVDKEGKDHIIERKK